MTSSKNTRQQPGAPASRRVQRHQQRKAQTRRRVVGAGIAVLVASVVVVIVIVARNGGGSSSPAFAGATVNVELGEYAIMGDLTVPAGHVRIHAVNHGGLPHNVGVRGGPITNNIAPGKSATIDLGSLRPGIYHLYCDVDDHVQRGMVATLTVTAPLPTTPSAASS